MIKIIFVKNKLEIVTLYLCDSRSKTWSIQLRNITQIIQVTRDASSHIVHNFKVRKDPRFINRRVINSENIFQSWRVFQLIVRSNYLRKQNSRKLVRVFRAQTRRSSGASYFFASLGEYSCSKDSVGSCVWLRMAIFVIGNRGYK